MDDIRTAMLAKQLKQWKPMKLKLSMDIDLSKKPEDINVLQYMILTILVHDKDNIEEFINGVDLQEDIEVMADILQYLENNMYLKVIHQDDWTSIELRKKATDLFPKSKGIDFTLFWDKYHEIAKKPKTDLEASRKYWRRLKPKEQQLALNNIENYVAFVTRTQGSKYIIKARTYLNNKNFYDEFESDDDNDVWTKNHV